MDQMSMASLYGAPTKTSGDLSRGSTTSSWLPWKPLRKISETISQTPVRAALDVRARSDVCDVMRQAEVDDFHAVGLLLMVDEHDVLQLEVGMNHPCAL